MVQKDILLNYLCAAIPYGVRVQGTDDDGDTYDCDLVGYSSESKMFEVGDNEGGIGMFRIDNIKPYLRPMSSMTDEEKKEFIEEACYELKETVNGYHYEYYWADYCGEEKNPIANYDAIDWLLENHFDFMGLIDKGLAIDCTGLDIY